MTGIKPLQVHFVIGPTSHKAKQIAEDTRTVSTFYWPLLGQQIRIRGFVHYLDLEFSAAEFRERGEGARAIVLLGRQSAILEIDAAPKAALARSTERLKVAPDLMADTWALYAVQPSEVEFWWGDSNRKHVRLGYLRHGSDWLQQRLRP